MALFSGQFSKDIWTNEHLEFKFSKNSLNTTCESQRTLILSTDQNITQVSIKQNENEQNQFVSKPQNFIKQTKNQKISKKSQCFVQQIKKVLKKNKLNKNSKQKNHEVWQNSYLNINPQKSKIHFKIPAQTQRRDQNQQKSTKIQKDNCEKSTFNLNQFFQKNFDKQSKKSALKKNDSLKNIKSQYFLGNNTKKKTNFVEFPHESNLSNSASNLTKLIEKSFQNQKQEQSCILSKQETTQKSQHFDKFIRALQKMNVEDLSKRSKVNRKPTKKLTIKEIRKMQIQKQNNQDNLKLQRSLRRALSNVSLTSKKSTRLNESFQTKQLLSVAKNHNQICFDELMTIQQIHFSKLKEKVSNKMEKYKRLDQIRKNQQAQQNQIKSNKKVRAFSAQPKTTFIIEGTAIAESRNDKEAGIFNKEIEKTKRPNTALTRTGLQFYQRQSHRRPQSNKENRQIYLTGINNQANHFRTFTRTVERQVQELIQCKSDRVVRNLQQKFLSRPKTARSKDILKSSRSPITNRPKSSRNSQRLKESFTGIGYEKVTIKQIQKQKMKQKLLEIMVGCEEEKFYNKKLMKGIQVFEDFCGNVDQGLKNITSQINQYLESQQ